MITVDFERLHTHMKLPKKSTSNAACMDVYLPVSYQHLMPGEVRIVPLGFKVNIPSGYKLEIYSRSGLASRGIIVANSVGQIDEDFTGEVGVILMNMSGAIQPLMKDDRICQIALAEVIDFTWEESNVIKETERNPDGFGSSGGVTEQGATS